MERGYPQSLCRPRTHLTRKPRLGSYLFLELDKVNGLHTCNEKDAVKATVPSKKGAFLQEIVVPRKKVLTYVSSHGYNAHKGFTKADEGTPGQTFKASRRKDKQRELHDVEAECFQETREPSHGSNGSNANGMLSSKQNAAGSKRRTHVNSKDLNHLARQSHVDKVSCTPGPSIRTQSDRRRVVPKKFYDEDTDKGRQKDIGETLRGQNTSRNLCLKYNAELVRKSEVGFSPHRKPITKHLENKVLKKGSPFKADEIVLQSDEGAHSIQETGNGGTTRESPCVSEARRHQHSFYAQEITPDRDDGQAYGDESSEEDVVSGSNDQSTPELEQSMHMDGGFGSPGALVVNKRGELQAPTVRKSSRVPKKRIFDDDDDEAPIRRQRKKLESEPGVEHVEEESTEGTGNELASECCERESTDLVGDEELFNDCCVRECLDINDVNESSIDEKKELLLTARQRALKISKEGGDPEGSMSAGFPYQLQPVLPKRQKENLTEAEQAIKKEEAARRRKQQMEKNAKEIQAVAIQKILGQESSRKKREEKLQKQRQEIEQEKQAAAMAPAVNSIRWVMGPSGNVVSFSQDIELPKIFSGPCSYPQEREKCAGPSCNNAYKYRDSKTRLPLCSLQCYRAVQKLPNTGPAF